MSLFFKNKKVEIKYLEIRNILRYYYVVYPEVVDENTQTIIFYHGSRGDAFFSLVEKSRLIQFVDTLNFILIFGQSLGLRKEPHIDEIYGGTSFGDCYWEIRDLKEGFFNDLEYTERIISNESSKKVNFIGHSNGGVFACLLAIYCDNKFSNIISHMGGIGWDDNFTLDFKNRKGGSPNLLFYTGTEDVHLKPCVWANDIFQTEGYNSQIYIEEGRKHSYHYSSEKIILDFIFKK